MPSDKWMLEAAENIAYEHLRSLEYLSVSEMLQGIPEWDALFEAEDRDDEKIDKIHEEIYELVMSADVYWPNVLQRYVET